MDALIYFALWAGALFLMMRLGCGAHVMGGDREGRNASGTVRWVPPETDRDPVCGKTVRSSRAKPSVYGGMVYDFCSRECREAFEAAPETYVAPAERDRAGGSEQSHA